MICHGGDGSLKCDLEVAPGAEIDAIRFAFIERTAGRDTPARVRFAESGDLHVEMGDQEFILGAPLGYQEIDGAQSLVTMRYSVDENSNRGSAPEISFKTDEYDRGHMLIIDPAMQVIGGSDLDYPGGMAVTAAGDVYVAGGTASADLPITLGVGFSGGGLDAFVAKYSAGTLSYMTYLGGPEHDLAYDVVVSSSGKAYVVGDTNGHNFPSGSFPPASATKKCGFKGGSDDVFLAVLNGNGTLNQARCLGGSNTDYGYAVALGPGGSIYVSGATNSSGIATVGPAKGTDFDGFVIKLSSPDTTTPVVRYLGGLGDYDWADSVGVDTAGHVYVAGGTNSSDFPLENAIRTTFASGEAFMTKLGPGLDDIIYSTFLGGGDDDAATDISVLASGETFVVGSTDSDDFFPNGGTLAGSTDAFLVRLTADGMNVGSKVFGGSDDDGAMAVAVDSASNAYVAGYTDSADFTIGLSSSLSSAGDTKDAFLAKFSSSLAAESAFLIGADNTEVGWDIGVDSALNMHVFGETGEDTFLAVQPSVALPDLKVTALSSPPASVELGNSFSVTDTVANIGDAKSLKTEVKYFLTKALLFPSLAPPTIGIGRSFFLTANRPVPVLAIGASHTYSPTVTIPDKHPLGTLWRLKACVLKPPTQNEKTVKNNCRISTGTITLTK
jgi:hypothetical protein